MQVLVFLLAGPNSLHNPLCLNRLLAHGMKGRLHQRMKRSQERCRFLFVHLRQTPSTALKDSTLSKDRVKRLQLSNWGWVWCRPNNSQKSKVPRTSFIFSLSPPLSLSLMRRVYLSTLTSKALERNNVLDRSFGIITRPRETKVQKTTCSGPSNERAECRETTAGWLGDLHNLVTLQEDYHHLLRQTFPREGKLRP